MIPTIQADNPREAARPTGTVAQPYCPECGQPFPRSIRPRGDGSSARSIFLVAIGLYLLVAFGLDAWRAAQRVRDASRCPSAERRQDCVALPHVLSSQIASRNLATGEAFAARISELQLGRDARYAAVGLVGLAVGLGAILLRARRARWSTWVSGVDLWLGAEAVLSVLYAQLIVIAAYQLVNSSPVGAPLALDHVDDSVYRALGAIFAFFGVL